MKTLDIDALNLLRPEPESQDFWRGYAEGIQAMEALRVDRFGDRARGTKLVDESLVLGERLLVGVAQQLVRQSRDILKRHHGIVQEPSVG